MEEKWKCQRIEVFIYKFPPWWGMDIFWNCTIILLNGWGDDLGGFCVAVSDNYDNFW